MSKEVLAIDGSTGSGSGTVVRDVAGLSVLTGRPAHLFHIRSKRDRPGLRPQHLKALQACADLSGGELRGAETGSTEVVLIPGHGIREGHYHWDVGTAGSATMLAMTLLPVGMFASGPISFTLKGGLCQDFSPTCLYMCNVLLPALSRMGARTSIEVQRPGYLPSGGGRLQCSIQPVGSDSLLPYRIPEPGNPVAVEGVALCSHLLRRRVATRMKNACEKRLRPKGLPVRISEVNDTGASPAFNQPAPQAGACLAIWAYTEEGGLVGSDMAGAPGRPSEEIGRKTAARLLEDLSRNCCVDRYLADQLVPFASLAAGHSHYRVPVVTEHIKTRLWLVQQFLQIQASIENQTVSIRGAAWKNGMSP